MRSPRRESFLNAAIQVFARYGFRKTSIDMVAQAAGASRQVLYLHFPSKEALFCATVEYALAQHLAAACSALAGNQPLADRLVAACDEWAGRYIGTGTSDAVDLASASAAMTTETLAAYGARFEEALAKAIAASPVMATYSKAGLTAQTLARTLHRTVQGIKEHSSTRPQFHAELTAAAAVLLAPLPQPKIA